MDIVKLDSFSHIYTVDCFEKEFKKATKETITSNPPYPKFQKILIGKLEVLDREGKDAIIYKAFEKLSQSDPPLYSIRFLKNEKNLRVLYTFADNDNIILLTVFQEKSSSDYERNQKLAQKRWKELNR